MKVYVIKRDDGKYLSKNYNFNYNLEKPSQTSWTENILNARTYKDKCDADNFCNTIDCQIIECSLMETIELADYTKQVRKEVVLEIKNFFIYNTTTEITKQGEFINIVKIDKLNKLLDQIQGE